MSSDINKFWIIIGIVILVAIFAKMNEGSDGNDEKRKSGFTPEQYQAAATLTCKDAIRARAHYPSTVQFPDLVATQIEVKGTFTAMNSFGARIPHRFDCRIDWNGTYTPTISRLYIEPD